MRRAEDDVLACKRFPRDHWAKIHSTNPSECRHKKIKRRTNAVGIFPTEAAITRRYMTLETVAAICDAAPNDAKIFGMRTNAHAIPRA